MKRRLRLAGRALAWLLTAALGGAEALLVHTWLYYGRYAAENMRAEETAFVARACAAFLLPWLLLALCGAAYLTVHCTHREGRKPERREKGYADDLL